MKLQSYFSEAAAHDIMTAALCGGSYGSVWLKAYRPAVEWRDGIAQPITIGKPDGDSAEGYDEHAVRLRVGPIEIARALSTMACGADAGERAVFCEVIRTIDRHDRCSADAPTCDTVLQVAFFNAVVYG
jgi:hypothetical protein